MIERHHIFIRGVVQGVGMRPFVYRLAHEYNLKGHVSNDSEGVQIEIEGQKESIRQFMKALEQQKPKSAEFYELNCCKVALRRDKNFVVMTSTISSAPSATVLPDLATCSDCLNEIFNKVERRYHYPFTNCTQCGPRFSIIESLPYDRKNTTLKIFLMCEHCRKEYEDPLDRRFHAQPIACPNCGPHLEFIDKRKRTIVTHQDALESAAQAIQEGKILALKGIGGFQLIVDAHNEASIQRLRERKRRPSKPFALMYPNLASVHKDCHLSPTEEEILCSPQSPIVILKKKGDSLPSVAPNNANLGVMLPYSPLHHLLLSIIKSPIVATSGNLSEEPIVYENEEAFIRLNKIADVFLVHNRPIARPLDDSIARVMNQRSSLIRRARGFAPLPVRTPMKINPVLAVGAHLKNTIAIGRDHEIVIGQHIGDLNNTEATKAFERAISDHSSFYQLQPQVTIHDKHPQYHSTEWAQNQQGEKSPVQHHVAHFFSCMAEHQNQNSALGVTWDGTGLGDDGTIWGGEFFQWDGNKSLKHVASFRSFPLPGGDKSAKEPSRTAIGLLYEARGKEIFKSDLVVLNAFSSQEKKLLLSMLEKEINTPRGSSVGRIFDAVAGLLNVCKRNEYEGQAAMMLESLAQEAPPSSSYPFSIEKDKEKYIIDWAPMLDEILNEQERGVSSIEISGKFHQTLAEIVLSIVTLVGEKKVFLSGGVFQNKVLLEKICLMLKKHDFKVFTHEKIPPNDGGISLGQVYYYACMESKSED